MKRTLLGFLVLALVIVASLIPLLSVGKSPGRAEKPTLEAEQGPVSNLSDLSQLPYNPAPWKIQDRSIIDGQGRRVSAAGVNINGYANLPKSKDEAATWAKKIAGLGIRVVRAHHMDGPLLDNPEAHSDRFQWWLDALKKVKIPVIIEFGSTRFDKRKLASGDSNEMVKWRSYTGRFCAMDLSNVVAACPMNEPLPTSKTIFDAQYSYIRRAGFKGLIFGSNSMVQPGPFGDFANGHYYCGLEGQKGDEFFEIEYKDQPWNHPKRQSLPVVATEIGHFWPASTRYQSEWQIVESLLRVDAQVICMFAYIDNVDEWTNTRKPIDKDSFFNDPERMETLARLVHKMAGVRYLPRTYTPGFKAVPLERGKWRMTK